MSHGARPPTDDHPSCRSPKGLFLARVTANEPICREHWRLVLKVPKFPPAEPGQFVQIQCNEPNDLGWTGGAFIRRPFSIGGLRREADGWAIEIMHRAIGVGTRWLSRLKPGDTVSILGPLGHPFRMPAADRPMAWLVGGGIGLPPLIWLAESLCAAGHTVVAFCGSRTADLLPLGRNAAVPCSGDEPTLCCVEFARAGAATLVATDDGSLGAHGRIPEIFARYADLHPAEAARATVYTCGPEPMMRAVTRTCIERGLPCQVCLERMMACGMGTCQSCVVRVHDEQAVDGWRYRLCCSDGPVFEAREVVWDG